VESKTEDHLRVARRNRDFARALLDPSLANMRPEPWEWVAVIAFYAAVHFVNAYLWEAVRVEPPSHNERQARLRRELPIRPSRRRYARLQELSLLARYDEAFVLPEQEARALVNDNLRYIEANVMAALNLPQPTW